MPNKQSLKSKSGMGKIKKRVGRRRTQFGCSGCNEWRLECDGASPTCQRCAEPGTSTVLSDPDIQNEEFKSVAVNNEDYTSARHVTSPEIERQGKRGEGNLSDGMEGPRRMSVVVPQNDCGNTISKMRVGDEVGEPHASHTQRATQARAQETAPGSETPRSASPIADSVDRQISSEARSFVQTVHNSEVDPLLYSPSSDENSGQAPFTKHWLSAQSKNRSDVSSEPLAKGSQHEATSSAPSNGQCDTAPPQPAQVNFTEFERGDHLPYDASEASGVKGDLFCRPRGPSTNSTNTRDYGAGARSHASSSTHKTAAVVFTIDNHIQSFLHKTTLEWLFETISKHCAVYFGPKQRSTRSQAYPVDVIIWRHSQDFHDFYRAETKSTSESFLKFGIYDAGKKITEISPVPQGNVFHFERLKQWVWDSFWQAYLWNNVPVPLEVVVTPLHLENSERNGASLQSECSTNADLEDIGRWMGSRPPADTIRQWHNNNKLPTIEEVATQSHRPSVSTHFQESRRPPTSTLDIRVQMDVEGKFTVSYPGARARRSLGL